MTFRSAIEPSHASLRDPSPQQLRRETFTVGSPDDFCADLWGPLVGTLTLKVGDRGTAEELAQEALARAWERWPEVSAMEAPDRWVFRVALNLAGSWIRRRGAERRARHRLIQRSTVGGVDVNDAESLDLRNAIRALPAREREVIILRYYGELSVRDVAELLNISEGSVKSAAFDARARLRGTLDLPEQTGDR